MEALIQIGRPSISAALELLAVDENDVRRDLAVKVIRYVEDSGIAKLILERARAADVVVPVLMLTVIALACGVAWYYRRASPARWARKAALPEITRLVDAEDHTAAFPLLFRALQILPRDPALNRMYLLNDTTYIPTAGIPAPRTAHPLQSKAPGGARYRPTAC